jgi:hypothetical protein
MERGVRGRVLKNKVFLAKVPVFAGASENT